MRVEGNSPPPSHIKARMGRGDLRSEDEAALSTDMTGCTSALDMACPIHVKIQSHKILIVMTVQKQSRDTINKIAPQS